MNHQDEWLSLIDNLENIEESLRVMSEKFGHKASFDMGDWHYHVFATATEAECQTTCCAIGVGIALGTISGMRLNWASVSSTSDIGQSMGISFGETTGLWAVQDYFNINRYQAANCFGAGVPSIPTLVAERMREVYEECSTW